MEKKDLISKFEKKREKLEEQLEELDLMLEVLGQQTKLDDFKKK